MSWLAPGLIVQQRSLWFQLAANRLQWPFGKAVIGTAAILAVIIVADRVFGPQMMAIKLVMYFAAALWTMLLAPMLFRSPWLHQEQEPDEVEPAR